jgi:hypothetical protein
MQQSHQLAGVLCGHSAVARPLPMRDGANGVKIGIRLGLGVLLRNAGAELDVRPNCLSEGFIHGTKLCSRCPESRGISPVRCTLCWAALKF